MLPSPASPEPEARFQHVEWTSRGLLLVLRNNLYWAEDAAARLGGEARQITSSGPGEDIVNGLTLASYRGGTIVDVSTKFYSIQRTLLLVEFAH